MDKFITPAPLPTPYEKELLTTLMEEGFEILTFLGPRASKAIRFGLDEVQPGQGKTNAQRLTQEIGDFCAVVDRLTKCGALSMAEIIAAKQRKFAKLDKFIQAEPPLAAAGAGQRRIMGRAAYYRQTMLIENNVLPAAWFIWCGLDQATIWNGPSEQAGRDWAAAKGIEIEFVEPLGSEPLLTDDEDYLNAFTTHT